MDEDANSAEPSLQALRDQKRGLGRKQAIIP